MMKNQVVIAKKVSQGNFSTRYILLIDDSPVKNLLNHEYSAIHYEYIVIHHITWS